MRRSRRPRPAGVERVPNEVLVPEIVDRPPGPLFLRLGPGRGLLDHPGAQRVEAVVNVWPIEEGWAEAAWPRDPTHGWFVAPIDLRVGHVLEFRGPARPVVGAVAGADDHYVGLLIMTDRQRAAETASLLLEREQSIWWEQRR